MSQVDVKKWVFAQKLVALLLKSSFKYTASALSFSPLLRCFKETQRNELLALKSVTLSLDNSLKCTASAVSFSPLAKCLNETQRNELLALESVTLSLDNRLKYTASIVSFPPLANVSRRRKEMSFYKNQSLCPSKIVWSVLLLPYLFQPRWNVSRRHKKWAFSSKTSDIVAQNWLKYTASFITFYCMWNKDYGSRT